MVLVYPLVGLILAIAAYVAKTELYDPWRRRRRPQPLPSAARPAADPQIAAAVRAVSAARCPASACRAACLRRPPNTPPASCRSCRP